LADQPVTAATQRVWRDYLDGHARNRHGRLRYDLADFGYDEADLRRRFAAYVERFDVKPERIG